MLSNILKREPKDEDGLMCALYGMEGEDLGDTIARNDVPGFVTLLMVRTKQGIRNALPADLQRLGLTQQSAWESAVKNTCEMIEDVIEQKISKDPPVLLLTAESSLAMHSILLNWRARPKWTGATGSIIAFVERSTTLVAPCKSSAAIDEAINALVGATTAIMCEESGEEMTEETEPIMPPMLWVDKLGFEAVVIGRDGVEGGPRLKSLIESAA